MPSFRFLPLIILVASGWAGQSNAQPSQAGVTVIDLWKSRNTSDKLYLSDIAEDIEHVRLETTPESLFYSNYKLIVTDEYIIVGVHKKPVLVFDRKGKFIRKIGSVGQGPGEFTEGSDLLFDPIRKILLIFDTDSRKLINYTIEGKFLSETKPGKDPSIVYPLTSDRLVWYSGIQQSMGKDYFSVWVTDRNGKFVKSIPEPPFDPGKLHHQNYIGWAYPSPEGMLLRYTYEDSVYLYNGNSLKARFFINLGDMKMPLKIAADFNSYVKNRSSNAAGLAIFTEPSFWMLRYEYQEKDYTVYYDLHSGKTFYINDLDDKNHGLINDIDGGPGAIPSVNENEKYWFSSLQPVSLLEWNEKGHFNRTQVLKPARQAEFKALLGKINIDDNPLIMIVKKKQNLDIR